MIVIGLILFGLGLMIVELIFVPGTTVIGIIGFVIYGYGIYRSFQSFGTTTGWLVLSVTALVSITFTVYSLKTNAWQRFALKEVNRGRVNEDEVKQLEVGEEGVSVSSIRPIGKGEFNDLEYEVRSEGNYIEENVPIRVIKIDNKRIFVEPINA